MCNCPNGYECPECMFPKKPIPHKHAELIKAWADGAKIEYIAYDKWYDIGEVCSWSPACDYRIKPEPKPDYSLIAYAKPYKDQLHKHKLDETTGWDIRLICDGETGKLKSVQII